MVILHGDLNWSGGCGDGEMLICAGCIVKLEPRELVDGLCVRKKEEARMIPGFVV